MPETTGQQTVSIATSFDKILPRLDGGTWFKKVREMRRHPTIKLARDLVVAPALASKWAYEGNERAPEGSIDFIKKNIDPLRLNFMRTAMLGAIDFGWQPFEKVFAHNDTTKLIHIKKLKPLLQDLTEIFVDTDTGAFEGFLNTPIGEEQIDIKLEKSFLFSYDVEGTDWYGEATLRAVELAYDQWLTVNTSANRYDKKIAGSMWVVHYPLGHSLLDGTSTSNDIIADTILLALESSGALKVPRTISALSDDLNADTPDAWKIELLTDGGTQQASFIDRQNYLDKLMIRGFSVPERSVLEGMFGTKAEAGVHADFAITNIELRHQLFLQDVNSHLVNQLLRLNWGPEFEDTVKIRALPLADPVKVLLKELFMAILANPDGFLEITDRLDISAISEALDVPFKPEVKDINETGDSVVD